MISLRTFMGDGVLRSISQDLNLVRGSSRVQFLDPTVMGLTVHLPKSSSLRLGGPHFYIINESAFYSVDIKDGDGNFLRQLNPTDSIILCLIRDTCSNHWLIHPRTLVGRTAGFVE